MAKAVIPRLRFPEFGGAPPWTEKVLGDEGEFLSTLTGKTAQHFGRGNAKFVTYMNVFANTFVDAANLGVVDVALGESQNTVEPGDVLFTVSSETREEVGMSSVVIDAVPNCYVNSFCAMFRFQDGAQPNLRFLGYSLRQPYARRHFVKRAQGSTRFNLSKPAFRSLPLLLPKPAEQQKIADCLTSLDEVIAAQGRKVETLKAHKRGLMQQLFPRIGETRPRLRFPEFRNAPDWAVKPFGKLYEFQPTNIFSRDQLNYSMGKVRNIHYGDIHTRFSTQFRIADEVVPFVNPDESLGKIKAEAYCREGDMVFADASEDLADVGKSIELVTLGGEKLLSGSHTILARQRKANLALGFGGYLFKSRGIRAQIEKASQGTKVLSISPTRLAGISVCFPLEKEEQQRISDCLASLDARITAEIARLAALKTHKQGLMQQLFPAPEAMGA